MTDTYKPESMVATIRQSPPIDIRVPYDAAWVNGKVILITGGASGFGAGFVQLWAKHGATVIVGDINVKKGDALCRDINKQLAGGKNKVHFVHCNVTDWQSQVNLFKEAVKLSPHGGIDCVVANAGIAGVDSMQEGKNLDAAEPPPPDFKIMDVNCTGVMYTTHLAYFWLPKNPGSSPCNKDSNPATRMRDRHLLLLGSIASLAPIAIQPQYGAAKHAVLGLFRSLRGSSVVQGIRVNLLCPYFIDTPIVPTIARLVLAGGAMGKVEDVVDAATRFVADSRILGRALVVGPKMHVRQKDNGEWDLVTPGTAGSIEAACFEPYADDWEDVDVFDRNFVKLLNLVQAGRGWAGWAQDIVKSIFYGLGFGR